MAKNKNSASPASNKGLIIIAVLVSLLLTLVGGAAYAVSSGSLDLKALFAEPEPPPIEMSEKPLFKKLDKFVVSLLQERNMRYMMLELSLVSHDPRMPVQADQLNTVIRNALLHYFSGKEHSAVRDELKDLAKLQITLRDQMLAAAENYGELLPIEEVLLTNVVIQ